MTTRDTILTINVVEPELVEAVNLHSKELGIPLKGLVLVDKIYAEEAPDRPRDTTGLFEEILCDFDNPDELQQALKPYMYTLLGATCAYESAIQPFRKVIPFLPYISTPSETSLLWSTEKPLMRNRFNKYDASLNPKYQYMEAKDIPNVRELIKGFEFPLIVKPSGLAKALLVTECKNEQELEDCLVNTFKIIDEVYEREHRRSQPSVLVEEMMQGDMYSTDAYITNDGEIFCLPLVQVITANDIGLPGFYSYRHIIPTGLGNEDIEAAFEVARSAIRALNLRTSSAHIELYRTSQGWKIIELGARTGGYREDLYREAYGIKHTYNDLAVRIGKKPVMPGQPIQHAAGFNIYADTEGIIQSIEGLDQAQQLDSVVYIHARAKVGDQALFASNGGDLIVDGILSNKDPEQLEKDMAKIREIVKIVTA